MNIFDKAKLLMKLNKDANQLEAAVKTKNLTKGVAAGVGILTLILTSPQAQQFIAPYLGTHPSISIVIGGLISILALFHNPKENTNVPSSN